MTSRRPRVLLIGLDAMESSVVHRLIDDGRLPTLGALSRRGSSGSLASSAELYAGGVWPTFYSGVDVPGHGVFHNKQWRAEAMRVEPPVDSWLPIRPFWAHLGEHGCRCCIVDVPMMLGAPQPQAGIHLSGWGTHDLMASGSWPVALWKEVARRHGQPLMPRERAGQQTTTRLLQLRAALLSSTSQLSAIASDLLRREPWDFGCVVFGAAHRAGHYLWDGSGSPDPKPASQWRSVSREPASALLEIYRGIDDAVGELLESVGGDTRVLVFALHGMRSNPGWADVFPDLIARLLDATQERPARRGALYAIRRAVPLGAAQAVLSRLPAAVTSALPKLWSAHMFDWSRTPYFPMPMDHAGYLRVNLRGREREGIVEPGPDYVALCDRLTAIIASLCDADSGRPIAGPIVRAWLEAAGARGRDLLPDLVVPWTGPPLSDVRKLVCTLLPGFEFDVPRTPPSGRTGNHAGRGWFIAAGGGIASHTAPVRDHDVRDLAPTVAQWLGVEPEPHWQGRPIEVPTGRGDDVR